MKSNLALVILAVACAGLLIALLATKTQSDKQHTTDVHNLLDFSNQLVNVTDQFNELQQVNLTLSNNFLASQQQLATLSNSFAQASGALTASQTSLQGAEQQITNLNDRIADLEQQNQALDDRALALTNTITALNAQIADIERKLASSETNNAFLERELEQQIAQRTELERKFNDLNELRAQVKKIRTALFVERRIQLDRVSATDRKGAELLVQPQAPPPLGTARTTPHYDLNVEVGSDGSVHVIPPLTNAPPR